MLWGKAWGWSLRVGGIWKVGVCVREKGSGGASPEEAVVGLGDGGVGGMANQNKRTVT